MSDNHEQEQDSDVDDDADDGDDDDGQDGRTMTTMLMKAVMISIILRVVGRVKAPSITRAPQSVSQGIPPGETGRPPTENDDPQQITQICLSRLVATHILNPRCEPKPSQGSLHVD